MRAWRAAVISAGLLAGAPALAGVEVGIGGVGGGAFWQPSIGWDGGKNFSPAGSPIASVQLDPFKTKVRPVFGLASAPAFMYSVGYDAYTAPILVAEVGMSVGSEITHATFGGHAGILSFGAGARLTHLPIELGPQGAHRRRAAGELAAALGGVRRR
jgi:hypothetical protein